MPREVLGESLKVRLGLYEDLVFVTAGIRGPAAHDKHSRSGDNGKRRNFWQMGTEAASLAKPQRKLCSSIQEWMPSTGLRQIASTFTNAHHS